MDYRSNYVEKVNISKGDLKFNEKGLLPAVLQDYKTGQVLMLAYMNEEAFEKTIVSGKATFWSRSRQKIWIKGETSGNYQYVKDMKIDCDSDTLLLLVESAGPACHTGNKSCFYRKIDTKFFSENIKNDFNKNRQISKSVSNLSFIYKLYEIIVDRKENYKSDSYTSEMLKKGIDRIGKKIGEEASEVIIAGKNEDKEEIIYETADLIYHLFIMLVLYDITIFDIDEELKKRHEK